MAKAITKEYKNIQKNLKNAVIKLTTKVKGQRTKENLDILKMKWKAKETKEDWKN